MENILPKSMIKLNPNSAELSQMISFQPLLTIENGKVFLDQKGLKVIESQILGNLHLVALESSRQSLLYSLYRSEHVMSKHSQERKSSGVWISNFPRCDTLTETQYLYLQTAATSKQDMVLIHNICSLICSCILVDMNVQDLDHLASGQSRIVFSRNNQNRDLRKKEMCQLVLLELGKIEGMGLRGDHNRIYEYLTQMKVYLQSETLYRGLHLLKLEVDRLDSQDWQYMTRIQDELKNICLQEPQKTEDLRRGPILRWYLQSIRDSLNSGQGYVEIQRCMQMDVSEGYHAFTIARDTYKGRLQKEMREEGVINLREVLQIAREQAVQEYRKNSEDAEYLVFLGDFMDVKEHRFAEENNRIFQLQNLNFLQTESQNLIERASRQKMDQESVQRQIDLLAQNYKVSQQGQTKYQLLAECLKYLHGTLNKIINERENKKSKKQLQAVTEQKSQLQARIKQLQKRNEKKGGCCSECNLM